MFFLYSCTVFYFIMILQLLRKNVPVYVPGTKKFTKSFPGYSTVPDSKINNSMQKTLIFFILTENFSCKILNTYI